MERSAWGSLADLHLPLLGRPSEDGAVDGAGGGGGGGGGEGGGGGGSGGSVDGRLPDGEHHGSLGATLAQTCFNIINIYVGIGLLSMPYAVSQGGWMSLGCLAALLPLFGLTGQLICRAFDLMPPTAAKTYPSLGRAAGGTAGFAAVLFFSILELFGGTLVLLMVCWQMMELLLPTEGIGPVRPLPLAAALSSACLLPLLFTDLRRLSRLSMVGSASTLMVISLVVSLLVVDPQRQAMPQQPPPGHHLQRGLGVLQSLGIFALSSSAHSTLPALRSSMHRPAAFPTALALSFAVMLCAYGSLAAAGYWYWGDAASPLVTTDLAINSYYSSGGGGGAASFISRLLPIDRMLAGFVLINCLSKYPGLNLILTDMLLAVLPQRLAPPGGGCALPPPVQQQRRLAAHALRLAIFGAGVSLALAAYSRLGPLLSLLGGLCSISCSLVLPTAFYASLAWRRLHWPGRCGVAALLTLGAALGALVTQSALAGMAARPEGGGDAPLLQPLVLLLSRPRQ